jgi:predicted Rossmann fold nucleotide-binding protein DprA/Smf involved in DNA uptake
MLTVRVQSVLDCPPEKVWAALQTSALHRQIIRPLVRFRSLDGPGAAESWTQGSTFHFRIYLFGVMWEFLGGGMRSVDELAQALGLGVPQLSGVLMNLEMKRAVRRPPGNRYERC